jgi:hypothetical protein
MAEDAMAGRIAITGTANGSQVRVIAGKKSTDLRPYLRQRFKTSARPDVNVLEEAIRRKFREVEDA